MSVTEAQVLKATRMPDRWTFHRPVMRDAAMCRTKCTCGRWVPDTVPAGERSRVHTVQWASFLETG